MTEHESAEVVDADEAHFTGLVADHHGSLVRLAYAMVGDIELARDVAQSAWVAAWRHHGELRDSEKVRGWLFTIAANEARRALRWRKLRQWVPIVGDPGPQAREQDHDARLDLVVALQRLSLRDRQILALRYALGETSAAIGEQVGLSDSAVRVRIGRVLTALREDLDHE